MRYPWLTLIALQCSMSACAGGNSGNSCVRDDECSSHFCKADGTCGAAETDGGTTDGTSVTGDGSTGVCSPNHDGSITASEVPLIPGQHANFRIATKATFNTAGTANPDGSRSWDLSQMLANDATSDVALLSPSGTWWASDFPTASYATTLASGSTLMGVFHVDATGVTLLGVVSPDGGSSSTKLTYDPPAKIVAYPVAAGGTFTSTSSVSGTASGVIAAYTEKYASMVDQVGTLKTPYGTFPVLRVATDLTRTSGFATLSTSRTFAWLAECFGTVATVTSETFESGSEFTDAAEVRRLAP